MSSSSQDSSEEVDDAVPDVQLASQSFLHARPGDAYLHGTSRSAKTSQARFSANVKGAFLQQEVLSLSTKTSTSKALESAYDNRFRLWRAELEQGFSLLFHGIGSKRSLLNRLAKEELARAGCVVVLNGFLSSAAISDLLESVEQQIQEASSSRPASTAILAVDKTESRILAIHQALDSFVGCVFLLIHNIDGAALRPHKCQKAIKLLASHPSIHLLASIDHMRSSLLFPRQLIAPRTTLSSQSSKHRPTHAFLHHHIPTYSSAATEAVVGNAPSTLFAPSAYPPLASIRHSNTPASRIQATLSVLASMNDNAKFVFNVLATAQSAKNKGEAVTEAAIPPSYAVAYTRIYTECRDSFIASSEAQFDTLLAEFKDHSIILSSAPEQSGNDMTNGGNPAGLLIWINLDADSLEKVQERML